MHCLEILRVYHVGILWGLSGSAERPVAGKAADFVLLRTGSSWRAAFVPSFRLSGLREGPRGHGDVDEAPRVTSKGRRKQRSRANL